jgi:hypothetical protein
LYIEFFGIYNPLTSPKSIQENFKPCGSGASIRKYVEVQILLSAPDGAILNQPTVLYFFKKVVAVVVRISR